MLELGRAVTDPEPCPYLHDRPARTEMKVVADIAEEEWAAALAEGYRRFGSVLFRPACQGCAECVPLRVPVERFRPSRSQRRVMRRNAGVRVEVGPPGVDAERLEVHRAFHRERSERVGWKSQDIGEEEYRRCFLENVVPTLELRYRVEGRLAAVAYLDVGAEALNSIYCYHHPDFRKRSLGTFDILVEIELARRMGRRFLYLGYHVAGCRSMAYKAAFRPCQRLRDGEWRDFPGDG